MAGAAIMAAAFPIYATIAAAIAVLGLPLYQLARDGFLPRLRRRH